MKGSALLYLPSHNLEHHIRVWIYAAGHRQHNYVDNADFNSVMIFCQDYRLRLA
jgi:hypothetical protein